MKYRLNLYTERFRPRPVLLNRWLFGASVGLLLLTLLAFGLGVGLSNETLAQRHRRVLEQHDGLQGHLLRLSKQIDGDERAQVIQDAIAAHAREIAAKQRLLEHLANSPLLPQIRFSRFMQALSKSHVQGLWLTRVRANGKSLELNGSSLSEELLPQWLLRLSAQADFRGRKFSALELSRPPDGTVSRLDFYLSTELKGEPDRNG
jgi:Tfp pilus assembly protein PilN